MADQKVIDGDLPNDQTLEINGDDDSFEISVLNQKISDLEEQNGEITRENQEQEHRIEELKSFVKKLSDENAEINSHLEKAESENKMLGTVASRAAGLEAEVSELKGVLEKMEDKEKEKDVKLDALVNENELLLEKIRNLKVSETALMSKFDLKEKEIQVLEKKVQELEAEMSDAKSSEKLKSELEATVSKMRENISALERSLEEKEKVITGFKTKERAILDGVNGDTTKIENGNKGFVDGLKQKDLVVVGGGLFAAFVVLGTACYVHASRKQ